MIIREFRNFQTGKHLVKKEQRKRYNHTVFDHQQKIFMRIKRQFKSGKRGKNTRHDLQEKGERFIVKFSYKQEAYDEVFEKSK